jgi:hypothetical protein
MIMKLIKLSMVMTALLVAACSNGVDGTDGASGKDGTTGANGKDGENTTLSPEESLSLITPGKGILDREVDVQIGGSGTKFDENAKLDFGDGVEVVSVTKSSPTLITARIKIGKTAKVGPRTVKIGSLEAQEAFKVIPAIEIDGGKVAQGGLVQFEIKNNDDKAFDTNAFSLEAAGLVDLGSSATGPFAATGFLLAAPLAKAGKSQVTVANLGPDGKPRTTFLSASDAMEVTARSPLVFNLDSPAEQTFGGLDTKLFKLTTAANASAFVDYRIEVGAEGTAVPVAFVFGTNGGVDDRIGQVLPSQNPFTGEFAPPPYDLHVALPVIAGMTTVDHYVILADLSGTSGAKATITASKVDAQLETEATSAHGPDAPQALGAISTTEARVLTANLAAATEQDVYKLSVAATDKIQLTAQSDADLEIVLTKDPNVLEDAQGTPPAQRKVLGYFYPGKMSAQRVVANPGTDTIYAVVQSDVQGTVATGKYTLGARKLQ